MAEFPDQKIPEPTRDDLLRLAHAEYRDQLASGALPAKNAEEIWAALRRQWYEGHRAEIAAQAKNKPELPRAEPESPKPQLPQAPDINDKGTPDILAEFHQDPATGKVTIHHHSPHGSHASRLSDQKLTRGEVWAEVKKHRGWYLLVFLLSGLPVYIATLWGPFMGSKTIPEWLAENGLPRLSVLIIGWVIVAAVVALVIVVRAYQTARCRQKTLIDPESSSVSELVIHRVVFRTVGGSDGVEYIPEIKKHGIKVTMLLDNETIPYAELQNISGQVWTESKYLISTVRKTPVEFPWERDRNRLRYRIWLPVLPKMSHVWLPTLVFALPPPGEKAIFGGEIVSKTSEFRQYRWWVANEDGKAVVHGGDATPDMTGEKG